MKSRKLQEKPVPLSRLSRHEIAAERDSAICVDQFFSKNASVNSDAVLAAVDQACGWYRAMKKLNGQQLTGSEIVKQAWVTAAMAEELHSRLEHMHRDIRDAATQHCRESGVGSVKRVVSITVINPHPESARKLVSKTQHWFKYEELLRDGLKKLLADLEGAASYIEAVERRPGPHIDDDRRLAFSRVYEAIRANSIPKMTPGKARKLARDLLARHLPDVSFPTDSKELRELSKKRG